MKLSVGLKNDNHLLSLINYGLDGDDFNGLTFGFDASAYYNLGKGLPTVGFKSSFDLYTVSIHGGSFLDHENQTVVIRIKDPLTGNSHWARLSGRDAERLLGDRRYQELVELYNQAALGQYRIDAEIEFERNSFKNRLRLGYRELNDRDGEMLAIIQSLWHELIKIYNFNSDTFSESVIGGKIAYLTIGYDGEFRLLDLGEDYSHCNLKVDMGCGVDANVPLSGHRENSQERRLNIIEPHIHVNAEFGVGSWGLKRRKPQQKWLVLRANLSYDPWDKLPNDRDPGVQGGLNTAMDLNIPILKGSKLTLTPFEFTFPLGYSEPQDILKNDLYVPTLSRVVRTEHHIGSGNQNPAIIARWATFSLTFRLNK